jgi:regulation of enolase protein 1 (concanavalin A-like superfamily)
MFASPFVLADLAATAQAADADDKPWQVVTNSQGNFTVEMPEKPKVNRTMTRNGPQGRVKLVISACETKDGTYLVQKVEFSDPIPKGVEETIHDALRNSLAEELKGKVATEKKVNLLGRPGRDFTIRCQPERGTVLNVRVRQYMTPNAIYQLYVVSEPNRNLPDGAGRFLGSFAPGLHPEGTSVKRSADAEATGTTLAGWGEAIDPGHDCTITPGAPGSLTIAVPGTLHDLNSDIGKFNAPRVVREVNGDFTAIVKVDGTFKPGAKGTSKTSVPVNAGGLFVWRDAENYIRLERMAMFRNGKVTTAINFEEREGGHRGAVHNKVVPNGTIYLRLQRKGNQITASISDDGQVFEALRPIDTIWPSKLKVGLSAINSAADPMTVQFSGFSLKTARP